MTHNRVKRPYPNYDTVREMLIPYAVEYASGLGIDLDTLDELFSEVGRRAWCDPLEFDVAIAVLKSSIDLAASYLVANGYVDAISLVDEIIPRPIR